MDETSQSAAYELGRTLGMLLPAAVAIGLFIFFIVALVKAFTRKSGGWIVGACISGVLCLLVGAGAIVAVVRVVNARTGSTVDTRLKKMSSPDGRVEISVPSAWGPMNQLNEGAAILAGHGIREQYVMVVESPKADFVGSLEDFDRASLEQIKSHMTDGVASESTAATLGGCPAQRRTLTGVMDNMKLFYIHATVETEDAFYQILCWTLKSREAVAVPVFEQVLGTFRTKAGPPQAKPDPEPDTALAGRVHRLIAQQLKIEAETIRPDARLIEDLGADELDVVELIMAAEEEFGVEIPDQEATAIKTPAALTAWLQSKASH